MKLTAPPTQRTEPGINSVASARRGTLRLTKTRSIRTDSDAPALDHPENDALEVFSSRSRMVLPFNFLVALVWVLTLGGPAQAADRQWLHSHVPEAVPRLQRIARPSPLDRLNLAIALPLRNRDALTRLLQQISNPASPQFRHYLTPEQFTEQFGPTKEDYASVIAFAIAHGLTLTGTHANRQLVDVEGAISDVEATLHLHLGIYSHPLEVRTFYAPDLDPSLDLQVPVLEINGLNNYTTPRPRSRRLPPTPSGPTITSHAGSGPNGNYLGNDFRLAYVPGISLTGAGQTVGLFELDGYFTSDITAYKQLAKLPNIPLQNVLVDGFNGIPTSRKSGSGNEEVALDIEMAMSIAPGLARVIVYEGSPNATTANINNLLNRMATDNLAKQLSCSWGFDISAATQQIFQQFAAQGQTFFLASGDNGAFFGAIDQPSDDPYITTVGGTVLTTTSTHLWQTETAWNGSGGGISTIYPIPEWQQSIDLTGNLGSSTMRNVPDVAMVALNVWVTADRGQAFGVQGTSIAAPLWAGFTALVNEQAATLGKAPVGFINPALYALGQSTNYATTFHDITTGNNTTSDSPDRYFAARGYDLCTGLGTPAGANLIDALLTLAPLDPLLITPPLGVTLLGPIGGPFNLTSQSYSLTNNGTTPLSWAVAPLAPWLDVSPTNGTLVAGQPAASVTFSLNSAASNLLIGTYTTTIWFTNRNDGRGQGRPVTLLIGNGGFEAGDLSNWEVIGDTNGIFADSIDSSTLFGGPSIPGIDDALFVHSDIYGAYLGQTNTLGYLTQTLPTVAGQRYRLSFWLTNPTNGTPNEFEVSWDGNILFDQTDLDRFDWTRQQYTVTAMATSTILQFGFRHDPAAFGLDDVRVQAIPVPALQTKALADGTLRLAWDTETGLRYQVQSKTDLETTDWAPLGDPLTASDTSLNSLSAIDSSGQRFYRVIVLP